MTGALLNRTALNCPVDFRIGGGFVTSGICASNAVPAQIAANVTIGTQIRECEVRIDPISALRRM